MIRLFDKKKYPDLKLVKYHVSNSTQSVIFFFHQRNKLKTRIYNSVRVMSGVHFFVMKRTNEILRHMAIFPNKPYLNLINPESTVYVIKDLINIIKVKKYTQKEVMKY